MRVEGTDYKYHVIVMIVTVARNTAYQLLTGIHHNYHWAEGVIVGEKISRKLNGKVLDSCVVPASTYGLEKSPLSELHQHKLHVCENNWIRRIAGVRREERRRMKDLREEVGTKACIVGKRVKIRMK